MIAELNILRSVGKVGVKPREGKTINIKIRVKSFQQCLVVNGIEGRREAKAEHDGTIMISAYVGKIIEDVRELYRMVRESRLEGREVG